MTLAELKVRLEGEGIDPCVYDLDGGHLSERHTIRAPAGYDPDIDQLRAQRDGELERRPVARLDAAQWHVYYSERGKEVGLRSFVSEADACAHFLERILGDFHLSRSV